MSGSVVREPSFREKARAWFERVAGGNPGECELRKCGKYVLERCNDLVCRDCHVSLTFEECVDGRWVERQRASYGPRRGR